MGTSPQVYVKPEGIYNDEMTGGELVTFPVTSPAYVRNLTPVSRE